MVNLRLVIHDSRESEQAKQARADQEKKRLAYEAVRDAKKSAAAASGSSQTHVGSQPASQRSNVRAPLPPPPTGSLLNVSAAGRGKDVVVAESAAVSASVTTTDSEVREAVHESLLAAKRTEEMELEEFGSEEDSHDDASTVTGSVAIHESTKDSTQNKQNVAQDVPVDAETPNKASLLHTQKPTLKRFGEPVTDEELAQWASRGLQPSASLSTALGQFYRTVEPAKLSNVPQIVQVRSPAI